MNEYKMHYAANLARAGKTVDRGIWDRRAAAMGFGQYGPANPAQCRSRANQIDFTTDPAKVTCVKCAPPAAK